MAKIPEFDPVSFKFPQPQPATQAMGSYGWWMKPFGLPYVELPCVAEESEASSEAVAELVGQTDQALDSAARHSDRIDELVNLIQEVRDATVV